MRIPCRGAAAAVAALGVLSAAGCAGLKYESLRGTSLPNPPPAPVAVYVEQFPVVSKASVLERRVVTTGTEASGSSINALAETGSGITEISRPCRIEDLVGSLLREMRADTVRVLADLTQIEDLGGARRIRNPFRLVGSEAEAQLILSGQALIRSQRVSKTFSQKTQGVELDLEVKDVATGRVTRREKLRAGIRMIFNSRELEEAMSVAAVTYLTQRTLF
ncbi:MAG: hypothetical protein AB1505_25445 [Candidatus Latescibacterota bacterium]